MSPRDWTVRSLTPPLLAALLLGSLAGCGGPKLYPISGQLVWQDGSPAKELAGGSVVLESAQSRASARGDIGPDGTFRVTTSRPGDGAFEGRYKVLIDMPRLTERELNMGKREPPPILDPRFGQLETSGLEITVEPKNNQVTLKVGRARSSARPKS